MSGFRVGMTTRLWSPASTSASGRTGSGNGSSVGIRSNTTAMAAAAAIDAAIALHIIRGALTDRRADTLCSFASAWRARSISSAASTSGLDTATRSASLAAAILCASAAHRRQSKSPPSDNSRGSRYKLFQGRIAAVASPIRQLTKSRRSGSSRIVTLDCHLTAISPTRFQVSRLR